MRARNPDREGVVERNGVSLGFEVFGEGEPTVLLLPTWTIVHSRFWKLQVPYLARHHRVITFDGPGNGRSGRPLQSEAYRTGAQAANALAVMDETQTERAVLVSLSKGSLWSLRIAAEHSDRVLGQVFIGPSLPLTKQAASRSRIPERFGEVVDNPQGWEKYNAHYWRTNYRDFAEFFFSECFSELHSTKQWEDCVGWAMATDAEILLADAIADADVDRATVLQWCERVTTPVLVIHGAEDRISPPSRAEALAAATGGDLVILEGAGHIPLARDPVQVNLALRHFIERIVA